MLSALINIGSDKGSLSWFWRQSTHPAPHKHTHTMTDRLQYRQPCVLHRQCR